MPLVQACTIYFPFVKSLNRLKQVKLQKQIWVLCTFVLNKESGRKKIHSILFKFLLCLLCKTCTNIGAILNKRRLFNNSIFFLVGWIIIIFLYKIRLISSNSVDSSTSINQRRWFVVKTTNYLLDGKIVLLD